jgi:hypothetical protein
MMHPQSRHALTARASGLNPDSINFLTAALKFVFSWIALTPIAIIVSGKLIAHIPVFRLQGQDEQRFGLRLPGVIHFVAKGDEVVFGFAIFIMEFFILSLIAGQVIYGIVKSRFGVDLGQFNSICTFSAFSSVILSAFLLLLIFICSTIRRRSDPVQQEYESKLSGLTRGRGPVKDADAPDAYGGGQ